MAAARNSPVRLTSLMCIAESLSMTGFACYTTLLPTLMKAWGLNNSKAGLIGGIFYTGYMVAVPVLTSLTDRVDSRRVYLFSCLLSVAGAAGFVVCPGGPRGGQLVLLLHWGGLCRRHTARLQMLE